MITIICNEIEGSTVLNKQKLRFFQDYVQNLSDDVMLFESTYINSQERKYKNENLVKRYSSSVPFYEKDLWSPEYFSL